MIFIAYISLYNLTQLVKYITVKYITVKYITVKYMTIKYLF